MIEMRTTTRYQNLREDLGADIFRKTSVFTSGLSRLTNLFLCNSSYHTSCHDRK